VLEPKDVIVCANQAAMVFEIHVTLAGGSTMIIDAVEVFVVDDDARIVGLSGIGTCRAHARALSAIVVGGARRPRSPEFRRLSPTDRFRPQSIDDER